MLGLKLIDVNRRGPWKQNSQGMVTSMPVGIVLLGQDHAHPFRSTSERSGAHMYHLFIDEIVEN